MRLRSVVAVGGAVAIVSIVFACGRRRLPSPVYVQHASSALAAVPFPPPAARAEFVPAKPDVEGVVWVDGEWLWQGRGWVWRSGRWVLPPPGARFAPWTSTRDPRGTFYVASSVWIGPRGEPIPDPRPLAVASLRLGGDLGPDGARLDEFVDASLEPPPPGQWLPEGGVIVPDASFVPDAGLPDVDIPPLDAAIPDAAPVPLEPGDEAEPTDGAKSSTMVPP